MLLAVEDDVNIAGAGLAIDAVAGATELSLDALAEGEDLLGWEVGADFYTGVEVGGRARGAAHGLCLVNLREVELPKDVCEVVADGFKGCKAVSHVGTEGEDEALHFWMGAAHDGLVCEAQNILHVVEAGGFVCQPESGADGTGREGHATGGFVGELEALAICSVHDGVVAHDIATAHGVHADLGLGACANQAVAAVHDVFVVV